MLPEDPSSLPATPEQRTRRFRGLLIFVLIFGLGLFIGRYLLPAGELKYSEQLQFVAVQEGERQLVFPTFWEAWDGLHGNFIGDLDESELFYGAVAGMVRATGDPYTVFSPPAATKQFEETIGGSFAGVGIEIGVRGGAVTVISPIEGSPAKEAGVREGDIILSVDGTEISQDTSIDDVVQRIRGEQGQAVTLTVVQEGDEAPREIAITRDTIEIESVKMDIADDIATIEITNFNGDTAQRFTTATREAKRAGVRAVIIDVRGNPGGFLDGAVDIASRFIDKGVLVVNEKGQEDKDHNAKGNNILKGVPVVVMVDQGSASASEILAGALHDQLGSPVVGKKTFGKGSVQEFMKLSDGSSLRVTVARWFTPNGRSIDEEGIEPTIEVEQDPDTEEDEQLERAKEEARALIR